MPRHRCFEILGHCLAHWTVFVNNRFLAGDRPGYAPPLPFDDERRRLAMVVSVRRFEPGAFDLLEPFGFVLDRAELSFARSFVALSEQQPNQIVIDHNLMRAKAGEAIRLRSRQQRRRTFARE